ncbi:perforin-like protein 1 [Corticium candelabrum]|uniref:perforin-like protein 1 n=1 Tax=Corticium candelabrum TaxID=121492 RepID=UPI002E2726A2|nr:perforin-like protein 1 [Corticium candelabrum]
MAITVYLAVAFLVAIMPPYAASLSPGRLIGIGHSPHDGLRFIGVGYNLLDGNPQGVHGLGGFDPGFRDTYRVLQLTYDQEKRSRDRLHSVADQVAVNERLSCSSSSERKAYTGAKGYQHDLSRSVDTSASGSFVGLIKFSFTSNDKYKDVLQELQSEKKLYMEKSRICNLGSVRYQTELAQCSRDVGGTPKFQLSSGFEAAVRALPVSSATSPPNAYFSFLDTWGTHVITEIVLGSKYIEHYEVTSDKAFRYSLEHNALGITTSASGLSASGSLSLDINKLVQSDSFLSSLTSVRKVIKIGSSIYWDTAQNKWIIPNPIRHEPIKITLTPITEFLSCRYTSDLHVRRRKSALARALTTYPSYKNARVPPDDSQLTLPIAWPKGTYGLVKPSSGCPRGSNSRWDSGWRKHDTEDGNSANQWSSSYNLAGWKGSNNMQWEFCIKVSNGLNNINYPWPRGSYCILKKGNCPNQFHYGWIHWDDEDSRNANSHGGTRTLPDGEYGRNTRMEFCCRQDGSTANHIVLPTNRPFILVAAKSLCQEVYGMRVSNQWFHWDNEDKNNADDHGGSIPYENGGTRNHRLHFCYYYK